MVAKDVALIEYSKPVDRLNCITHAMGAFAAVVAAVLLILKADGLAKEISAVIYGLSMVAVYTVSAVYHGLENGERKRKARLIDHSTVPILIAGTATPCALLILYKLSPVHGILVLILAWGCTLFGIFSKIFFFEKLKAVTVAVYIGSCVIMLGSAVPYLGKINTDAFALLLYGNLAYVSGAVFCGLGRKREWLHVVFHVFVIAASAIHYLAIYKYII